jgi:GNAT superfamily N-acetyltransferase
VNIRQVRLSDPTVMPLLAGLAAEYEARYGPGDEMAAAGEAEFDPPSGLFLALVNDGVVMAGGGYRRVSPGTCEVKRMWTDEAHRRHGHASTVLRALEDAARAAGYTALRLETGPAQPEAVALYITRGYRRVPVFGRYPDALAFEKALDGGGKGSDRAATWSCGTTRGRRLPLRRASNVSKRNGDI